MDESLARINSLENADSRALLIMHHLNRVTFEEISEMSGHSTSKLKHKHLKALAELERVLNGQQ